MVERSKEEKRAKSRKQRGARLSLTISVVRQAQPSRSARVRDKNGIHANNTESRAKLAPPTLHLLKAPVEAASSSPSAPFRRHLQSSKRGSGKRDHRQHQTSSLVDLCMIRTHLGTNADPFTHRPRVDIVG